MATDTSFKIRAIPGGQASGKISYEEFLATADGKNAEWVDGEIVYMTPVSYRHTYLNDFLTALLRHFIEARELGRIVFSCFQMKGPAGMPGREPDIMFIANENLPRLKKNFLDGPANLAVEIVSPESRTRDWMEKLSEYERIGVREYWIIDPDSKRAEFRHLDENQSYHLLPIDPEGVFHSEELPGLWLKVDWLWQEPLPTLMCIIKAWGLI